MITINIRLIQWWTSELFSFSLLLLICLSVNLICVIICQASVCDIDKLAIVVTRVGLIDDYVVALIQIGSTHNGFEDMTGLVYWLTRPEEWFWILLDNCISQ